MALLRTIFFSLFLVLSFLVGTLLTLAIAAFTRSSKTFRHAAQIWSKALVLASGSKLTVKGLENIPKDEPLIIVSNHQSAADIIILLAAIPRYFRFVIKKELFAVPIFGFYLRMADYVRLDREAGASSVKSLLKADVADAVLIFPEGTRSGSSDLLPFKKGSLFLVFNSKARVLPVAINGSYKIVPKGSAVIKPTDVTISFGPPLDLTNYPRTKIGYEQAMGELRNSIEKML
ncbi:hypothetical protein A2276_08220 [candidate division WOR-1 bacterium RIFOXYA12_FULL_43_27]|uniref:Phospholipid/glycerol acyltransferase domain-containing protein n=1 Tax=candidate division WOR-1 bacterium RIFOXYC2_FULL_46_14 TaxID=1802587 RepID=A0A1F4U692_UNCSA|nr:MAG: hypothetical protein A2276_08220 [candidate division WOR-1 bacterium RIFOXYA12_FULL_43_27]OGC20580.1 MAG: hypothetical protein A2292_06045 [candidate division WOR-1 bacterium RIFOXYB2_FULL_46_45]OGC31683.1 MAG: hypothetical protein A2232_05405 [candidate division WOR-1 bacterium RIFOXYA2_FULL_46_56]OGC40421.1 MAG: hypothetical protein A2438_04075 [candidate division WOR-1 bacterium RIFOXYC2_FULL_46_14]